jgi:hypothetical protein
MGCENATEVRSNDFDLAEGNTVDGFRGHVSRMCENRKRMKIPFARTTDASVLDSREVVGTAGRSGLGGSVVLMLDGVGSFFVLQEYNSLELEW